MVCFVVHINCTFSNPSHCNVNSILDVSFPRRNFQESLNIYVLDTSGHSSYLSTLGITCPPTSSWFTLKPFVLKCVRFGTICNTPENFKNFLKIQYHKSTHVFSTSLSSLVGFPRIFRECHSSNEYSKLKVKVKVKQKNI